MILAARAGSSPALRASQLGALYRVFACHYGGQRRALRDNWVRAGSKWSVGYRLANVYCFTSTALPFHGGLVGAYSFLRQCVRGRGRALCDDLSTMASPSARAYYYLG